MQGQWIQTSTLAAIALGCATAAVASAQEPARLISGDPALNECVGDPQCADEITRLMSHELLYQAFAFQHDPQATSVVVSRGKGWVVGVQLSTMPFTKERSDPTGKAVHSQYSPVLPRVVFGKKFEIGKIWHVGFGINGLPYIPIGGEANAGLIGADLSTALVVGPARLGLEGDFTWSRATAPMLAAEDHSDSGFIDAKSLEENCGEFGCRDEFDTMSGGVKAGASFAVGLGFAPYVKVGITGLHHTLVIDYDESKWGVSGVQLSGHAGFNWTLVKKLHLTAGTALAYRPAELSVDDAANVMFKIECGVSVTF